MSALHHLLRRSAGALALALACAVLLGSLCPRGWFVCVHDDAFVLVDGHHASSGATNDDHACAEAETESCATAESCATDCCPAEGTPSGGCLDLALSLVLDDQVVASPNWAALPSGPTIANVPDLRVAALKVRPSVRAGLAAPPPLPFVSYIRLLV